MDTSKYRQQLRYLFDRQMGLLDVFMGVRALVKGGIYMGKTKCGNKGCICEREGKLHTAWRFFWSEKGKAKVKTISENEVLRYEKYTKNYQSFRQARARLIKLQRQQIELIDLIEKGLRKKYL